MPQKNIPSKNSNTYPNISKNFSKVYVKYKSAVDFIYQIFNNKNNKRHVGYR